MTGPEAGGGTKDWVEGETAVEVEVMLVTASPCGEAEGAVLRRGVATVAWGKVRLCVREGRVRGMLMWRDNSSDSVSEVCFDRLDEASV